MEDKELNKTPLDKESMENQQNLENKEQDPIDQKENAEEPAKESNPITEEAQDAGEVIAKEESKLEKVEAVSEEAVPDDVSTSEVESAGTEIKEDESAKESSAQKEEKEEKKEEKPKIPEADLEKLNKEELVNRLALIIEIGEIHEIREEVEAIKKKVTQIHQEEVAALKEAFVATEEEKEFKPNNDPLVERMHYLANNYRNRRVELAKKMEYEKENNLKVKNEIIEEIKKLTQSPESINKTFHHFHELQDRWRETGPVPRTNVKDLYENYHLQVEIFYDYIKINKELRDYDLKKNLEKKVELCEKAESLQNEESEVKAFSELQELHKEWRETGPVPKEQKEPLWERFKAATGLINKKHQKYYDKLRGEQKENLEKKTVLCEKVEGIANTEVSNPKEWNKLADEVLAIQKEWRTIGFAPKKHNNKIYERFRAACDLFFERKRAYYHKYKEVQEKNLAAKRALIEKAESMLVREDWKEATEAFILIQKEWKKIGPVPRKHSDAAWKKFREACDAFFEKKNAFFHKIDDTQVDNLKAKNDLIVKVEAYKLADDVQENIKALNEFKKEWSQIGHVPIKEKDNVYNNFRNAINRHFDQLDMAENDREMIKYQSKIEEISQTGHSNKLYTERNKLFLKLRALESDVSVWENNLGFFSGSKDSENLVKDFAHKIAKAKERIQLIAKKIKMIDKIDDEQKK